MIRVTGIFKSYGDLKVLKGIDLEVNEKEVVTIVGASGAGKTTLLQIIGTLDKPDSGTVLFNGQNVSNYNTRTLASFRNRNIGFVFQFHQLLPEFTALENVCIPALIAGTSKAAAEEKATSLLGFLGMGERLDHKPSQLSGGEQQRVAVARAIINSPSIILADEPSGNLDTENKKELHNLFFRLRDTFGLTFIIVTHDPQLASMSDRTIRIKDGLITDEV
jgi:lipoprotein-releasing system ATP-binding protein